jgi:ribulose 1,5-bisphosphate synthetase/thiazole synthase
MVESIAKYLATTTLLVVLIEARQYSRTSTQYGAKLQNTILVRQEAPTLQAAESFSHDGHT